MNEETTKSLHDKRSFEERVFARFDACDARFDSIEGRLENLEVRSYDTKPIWERALTAIMQMSSEVGEIKTKVGAIEGKVGAIETKVSIIESKVDALETQVRAIKTDQRTMRDETVDVRREMKHRIGDRVDMILKFMLEGREDIRDAEARIRELESKLA
jgi:chromosome segregation ATPase